MLSGPWQDQPQQCAVSTSPKGRLGRVLAIPSYLPGAGTQNKTIGLETTGRGSYSSEARQKPGGRNFLLRSTQPQLEGDRVMIGSFDGCQDFASIGL